MMRASLARAPELGAAITVALPLKRSAVPEEVVDYILFLCGPGGSYINGTGLVVEEEGGWGMGISVDLGLYGWGGLR